MNVYMMHLSMVSLNFTWWCPLSVQRMEDLDNAYKKRLCACALCERVDTMTRFFPILRLFQWRKKKRKDLRLRSLSMAASWGIWAPGQSTGPSSSHKDDECDVESIKQDWNCFHVVYMTGKLAWALCVSSFVRYGQKILSLDGYRQMTCSCESIWMLCKVARESTSFIPSTYVALVVSSSTSIFMPLENWDLSSSWPSVSLVCVSSLHSNRLFDAGLLTMSIASKVKAFWNHPAGELQEVFPYATFLHTCFWAWPDKSPISDLSSFLDRW